jgi:hypothetical protein
MHEVMASKNRVFEVGNPQKLIFGPSCARDSKQSGDDLGKPCVP